MAELVNCILNVIGNNSVGKSTLINRVIYRNQIRHEYTDGFAQLDWNIEEENLSATVNIQENNFNGQYLRNSKNSIVVWVIENNMIENESTCESIINSIPDNTIVIAIVNLKEASDIRLDVNKLKETYSIIRDIFVIDSFLEEKSNMIDSFRLFLKNAIINAFTTRLDTLKEKLRSFTQEELDLGKSSLTSLYEIEEVFNIPTLKTLILSNEWGENDGVTLERKESSNNGSDNILTNIPKEIIKLNKLEKIICGGNWNGSSYLWQIRDIEPLTKMKNLSILNVSNNKIRNLEGLDNLIKLKKLHCNNNEIDTVPNLTKQTELKELFLSNNRLKRVNFLKDLQSICTLDLHSNLIEDLSPIKELISRLDIENTKWKINSISISSNRLVVPTPEVISQGKEKILAYFRQYEAEQKIKLPAFKNKDIKLILVGNSNVGKTSLVNLLKPNQKKASIASTHWMELEQWTAKRNNKKYNVRIFDFGGQEYYHDTHHLFFSNKTAYLVLWEEMSNFFREINVNQKQPNGEVKKTSIQSFPLEYWLDSINFHLNRKSRTESEKEVAKLLETRLSDGVGSMKDSDNTISLTKKRIDKNKQDNNILIVQNKVDSLNQKSFLNQKLLKSENNRILDFSTISIHKQKGIEHFKDLLFEMFNTMPIVDEEYLGTWGLIKKKIEEGVYKRPMELQEFKNYCNKIISKLPELKNKNEKRKKEVYFDLQDTESFAQYLNDIGVLLYYPENQNLKNSVFLNQKQVLKNIYDILLGLNSTNGEFDHNKVTSVLSKDNIDHKTSDIVTLMLHFKIIFEHPSKSKTYIAPLYLPKEPIESLKIFISIFKKPIYRYEYKKFIHKNVILDFFNCYGKHALKDTTNDKLYYWRDGIIISDPPSDEIIMVKFYSCDENGQRSHIDIFRNSESKNNELLIRVIADLDSINSDWDTIKSVTLNGDDFVPLDTIHENENNENWTFQHGNKYFKLLDFSYYLKNKIKMKKIFISYSKQDLVLVNKFIEHLSALKIDGLVSDWYCTELTAGSDWNNEIQTNFDEADIVCFMISPNFMKTKYIHEHEIDKAFKKKEQKGADFAIVPIILDFCRWSTTKNNLSQYTALPYTAKPVVDFQNQNMAWYIIQECLRLLILGNLNPTTDDFYKHELPKDVKSIYERIVENKVNI